MVVTEADDLEHLFQLAEAEHGVDMTAMREVAADIIGMPVGESTPPHGTLREAQVPTEIPTAPLGWVRDATLLEPPVICEGLNESAEGKFYRHASLRPKAGKPDKRITLRGLNTEVAHLRQFVAVFAFFVLFALAVMLLNW